MNGILIVDKPSGMTSHDVCQHFKRTLPVKKVGHAGTLDPLATGVLVILLDNACKLQSVFMGKNKVYQFTMRLGVTTDSYDADGKVKSEADVPSDALRRIEQAIPDFLGEIDQVPPIFSAIRKNGQRLYKLARNGIEVKPDSRRVRIHTIEMIEAVLPDVTLKVSCACGTYIRSLAYDLGRRVGCGAHVTALRRLRSEPFGVEEALDVPSFRNPVKTTAVSGF